MALTAEEVEAILRLRDEMTPKVKKAEKTFKASMQSMRNIGLSMSAAVSLPLAGIGAKIIKLGMDAEEAENLFEVSFGGMADAARAWSETTSDAFSISARDARKSSAMFFTMMDSMGLSEDAAFNMSTRLVELSGDMASFYNLPHEAALEKIRAGLVGESEPLKQLGILVDETTVAQAAMTAGIVRQGEKLTQQDKILGRFVAMLEQTKKAQGDAERTAGSATNQLREMIRAIKSAATDLGVALIPAVTDFLRVANSLIPVLTTVVEWVTKMGDGFGATALTVGALTIATGPVLATIGLIAPGVTVAVGALTKFGNTVPVLALRIKAMDTAAAIMATTVGVKLKAAFLAVAGGIKAATAASLAFMATPLGMIIGAVALAVGGGVLAWRRWKRAAAEAAKAGKEAFKTATELKSGFENMVGKGLGPAEDASRALALTTEKLQKEQERAKKAAEEHAAALEKLWDDLLNMHGSIDRTVLGFRQLSVAELWMRDLSDSAALTTTEAALLEDGIERLGVEWMNLQQPIEDVDELLNRRGGFFGGVIDSLDGLIDGLTRGQRSFAGFMSSIGKGITDSLGGLISGGISSGISAIGGLFRKLFGEPEEAELNAREIVKVWEDAVIDGLSESQLAEAGAERWKQVVLGVRDAFVLVGKSEQEALDIVEKLWDAIREGPKAVQTVLDSIDPVIEKAKEIRETFGDTITGLQELLAEAATTGELLPQHLEPFLETLQELGRITGEDVAGIMGMFAEQSTTDWQAMEAAAKKYGVEISALGKPFEQARIDAEAKELMDAFNVLTGGGTEAGVALTGMKDEFAALAIEAAEAGLTLPADMQPIMRHLSEQGLLIEENADLIKDKLHTRMVDFADLDFAEPVVDKVDLIIDAVQDLIEKLGEAIALMATAGGAVPTASSVGGRSAVSSDMRFQSGGTVPRTGVGFLHAGEHVMTPGAFSNLTNEVHALRVETARSNRDMPRAIGVAVDDAMARRL